MNTSTPSPTATAARLRELILEKNDAIVARRCFLEGLPFLSPNGYGEAPSAAWLEMQVAALDRQISRLREKVELERHSDGIQRAHYVYRGGVFLGSVCSNKWTRAVWSTSSSGARKELPVRSYGKAKPGLFRELENWILAGCSEPDAPSVVD